MELSTMSCNQFEWFYSSIGLKCRQKSSHSSCLLLEVSAESACVLKVARWKPSHSADSEQKTEWLTLLLTASVETGAQFRYAAVLCCVSAILYGCSLNSSKQRETVQLMSHESWLIRDQMMIFLQPNESKKFSEEELSMRSQPLKCPDENPNGSSPGWHGEHHFDINIDINFRSKSKYFESISLLFSMEECSHWLELSSCLKFRPWILPSSLEQRRPRLFDPIKGVSSEVDVSISEKNYRYIKMGLM